MRCNMGHNTAPKDAGLPAFDVCVRGNTFAVREALEKVLEGLGPLGLDIEEAGTIEIVLAEALNNIVEHAYACASSDGPIRINCEHRKNGLHLTIHDEGVALPDEKAPLGALAPIGDRIMDMPEGGFGWFLINDLARDIKYRRIGNENELSLRLAIGLTSST